MKKIFRFLFSRATLGIFILGLLVALNTLSIRLRALQRETATISVDREKFQKKLEVPPPQWMVEQIKKDLSQYAERGISLQMLDEGFYGNAMKRFNLARFHIKDRLVAFTMDGQRSKSRHFQKLLAAIETLNDLVELPEVDFILSMEDGFGAESSLPLCPWFVFAKDRSNDRHLLIPDFAALGGYARIREMILAGNKIHPWETKIEKAFWRGSTTGGYLTPSTWHQIARSKLVLFSLEHPQEVDARFHHVVQCTPEIPRIMKEHGMIGKSVTRDDHLKYKYLVDVDGNSCSFERFFWLLLSNSLVLKQDSPNIQWYYGGLDPYQHFLPVKQDLSDLGEKIEWARSHDKEAKEICERASQFVEKNLSNEDILLYLYHLLKEYARLQRPQS